MKNRILKIFSLVFVLIFASSINVFAQQSDHMESLSNKAHVYSVTPGSEEWKKMTPAERYASCEITQEEVEEMTTEALVETVLNYPYFINIYAYDTLEDGIESVSKYFPGIQELISRDDAADILQMYKNNSTKMQSNDSFDIKTIGIETLSAIVNSAGKATAAKKDTITDILPLASLSSVTTPRGTKVDAYYNLTWSDHGSSLAKSQEISNALLDLYPSAEILRKPSPSYNCHSYAWHSTSSSNKYWIDDPSAYIDDGSYVHKTAAVGNKVTYKESRTYTHSGVISSISGGPATVTSKWGSLALFSHDINDCPYVSEAGSGVTVSSWGKA